MTGQVVLLTGGTSGIGRITARLLADRGATVVITGRNRERGERVITEVNEETDGAISLLTADFAEQTEVRQLAHEFRAERDRLDVLVHNAGTYRPERRVTSDGIEETFAVNHLAPFLLTYELVDLLVESTPARVVVVSSGLHERGHIHFDDLQLERNYDTQRAYAQSKLANVLFTYELAGRLDGTGVTANALHPGVIPSTRLERDSGLWGRFVYHVIGSLPGVGSTPKEAASTTAYLAASTDVENVSGAYYTSGDPTSNPEPTESSRTSYNETLQKRLWEVSADLVDGGTTLPVEPETKR